jgi:hypothetical protein
VPSYGTVEENLRIKLQAVRIGGILLASCSCEPQSDLIRNIESRTDNVKGDMWLGFDYAKQAAVDEGWPGMAVRACYPLDASSYSCPDSRDRWGQSRLTVTKAAFDHMEAEINNDANGWNASGYVAKANSEPASLSQIKGNFTHTELGVGTYAQCGGYGLSVGLGHTGDYDGYTVSYREYMARDAYRKALTSYGAHTADYMATNLVAMAANLLCGTPVPPQATDSIATADEQRQNAEAVVLGNLTAREYAGWSKQVPDNAGPARALAQPWSVQRFDVTQFRWVGGDNWTDNPTVTVQHLVNGQWQSYADESGEVPVFLDNPGNLAAQAVKNRQGKQQWSWRASFEAFDAFPRADVTGGQVAAGSYRFVVDGQIHTSGKQAAYHLTSAPFTVSPWTGMTVSDLRRDGSGQVSFVVNDVYPRLPSAAHRTGIRWYADDQGGTPGHSLICKTCSFRPWATSGQVTSAAVEATDVSGHTVTVAAAYDSATGRWVATVPTGASVRVPAGGLRDAYGETNGTTSAAIS